MLSRRSDRIKFSWFNFPIFYRQFYTGRITGICKLFGRFHEVWFDNFCFEGKNGVVFTDTNHMTQSQFQKLFQKFWWTSSAFSTYPFSTFFSVSFFHWSGPFLIHHSPVKNRGRSRNSVFLRLAILKSVLALKFNKMSEKRNFYTHNLNKSQFRYLKNAACCSVTSLTLWTVLMKNYHELKFFSSETVLFLAWNQRKSLSLYF